jgi:hypothetical protein
MTVFVIRTGNSRFTGTYALTGTREIGLACDTQNTKIAEVRARPCRVDDDANGWFGVRDH